MSRLTVLRGSTAPAGTIDGAGRPSPIVEGYTAHGGKVSRFGGLFVQDMQLMIADQAVFDNLEAFGSGMEMRLAGNEAQPAFDIGPGTRLDMLRERQIQVEQPELFILITEQGENNQVGLQADRAFEFLRGDGQYRAGITPKASALRQ